jgi:putative addiction module component (TIGR02574 family)
MRKKPQGHVASAKRRARSAYEATKDLCGIAETSDPGLSARRMSARAAPSARRSSWASFFDAKPKGARGFLQRRDDRPPQKRRLRAPSYATKTLSNEARKLSPAERIELVDDILASLDEPDPAIDRLWAREAEERLAAYRRGEIKALALEKVLVKYRVK